MQSLRIQPIGRLKFEETHLIQQDVYPTAVGPFYYQRDLRHEQEKINYFLLQQTSSTCITAMHQQNKTIFNGMFWTFQREIPISSNRPQISYKTCAWKWIKQSWQTTLNCQIPTSMQCGRLNATTLNRRWYWLVKRCMSVGNDRRNPSGTWKHDHVNVTAWRPNDVVSTFCGFWKRMNKNEWTVKRVKSNVYVPFLMINTPKSHNVVTTEDWQMNQWMSVDLVMTSYYNMDETNTHPSFTHFFSKLSHPLEDFHS